MSYLLVVVGFVLMVGGADYFIKGAVRVATRFGLPPLIIGLTIVAWGTSLPELAVTLGAAGKDAAGLALGNVIGSNIANVLLIGGVAALIIPLYCDPSHLRRNAIILAIATGLVLVLGVLGQISVWMGGVLFGMLLVQTVVIYHGFVHGNADDVELPDEQDAHMPLPRAMVFFTLGLLAVLGGSELLIRAAIQVAQLWQVPDAVIGVTLVAIGTSLPELVTSVAAARQGQRDVIIGNIVGSNIANILLVLGAVSFVSPGAIPAELLDGDGLVMVLSTALFLGLIMLGTRLSRWWGVVFLASYVVYTAWQFQFFGLLG